MARKLGRAEHRLDRRAGEGEGRRRIVGAEGRHLVADDPLDGAAVAGGGCLRGGGSEPGQEQQQASDHARHRRSPTRSLKHVA
jgi:hypothetical protein